VQADLVPASADRGDDAAVGVDGDGVGPLEAQRDRCGAGTGRDQEVELQLVAGAVVDDVDAGVDVAVGDAAVGGGAAHPTAWLLADEVRDRRLWSADTGRRG
jgi:hypothetical protein